MGLFSRFKNKQPKEQKEQKVIDPIANAQELMVDLDDPEWLQIDLITVLKSKQKSMSNEEINDWLKLMASRGDYTIPEEFQDEKTLNECFSKHFSWVVGQIEFNEENTYENANSLLKKLPANIQQMNLHAQKAYLAVSFTLLNIFAQLD